MRCAPRTVGGGASFLQMSRDAVWDAMLSIVGMGRWKVRPLKVHSCHDDMD
jgi:hypothetical protein